MPQVFRRRANAWAQWVVVFAPVALALLAASPFVFARSDYQTGVDFVRTQPVPFSHEHHVGALGLDCRYCHGGVETSADAGMPASEVCMTCHSQIWTNAAMLAPVRESLTQSKPIRWQRVNDLADFVYFNHAIHVNKGIACVTCHGQIDRMPLLRAAHPMQMSWCLGCHRDPAPNLVPTASVFDPKANPGEEVVALHRVLLADQHIDTRRLTDCYVCHR